MTDRVYFMEGVRRGYDMQVIFADNQGAVPIRKEDIVLLSNIRAFDRAKLLNLPGRIVTFTHDTWCKWRLYLPMSEQCLTACPEFDFWNQLYTKAEWNVFLSPLHFEVHKMRFGDALEPHFITPSGIDVSQFRNLRRKRKNYCNVNSLMTFKGRENLLQWAQDNPDKHLDIAGYDEEPGVGKFSEDLPENVTYAGVIPNQNLNEWLNKYRYYIELPNAPAPFNRTCAEAFLAGCSLITNKLMGCTSYPWFTSRALVRRNLQEAPGKFYDALERELKL